MTVNIAIADNYIIKKKKKHSSFLEQFEAHLLNRFFFLANIQITRYYFSCQICNKLVNEIRNYNTANSKQLNECYDAYKNRMHLWERLELNTNKFDPIQTGATSIYQVYHAVGT